MNQSSEDRMERLRDGRCPVHGAGLRQASPNLCSTVREHDCRYDHDDCPDPAPSGAYRLVCDRGRCRFTCYAIGSLDDESFWVPQEVWDRLPEGYPA